MPKKSRLTYSNVVSTLALFLVLSGGVAFAASKVHTNGIFKRAVTSGKLALGAVRSNQIADGAVSAQQIADSAVGAKQITPGAVGSKQIGASSVAPSNLQFPVYFSASPLGGSMPVPGGEFIAYPISDPTWTQNPASSTSSSVVRRRRSPMTARAAAHARSTSKSTWMGGRSAVASCRPTRPRPKRSNRASAPSRRSTRLPLSLTH